MNSHSNSLDNKNRDFRPSIKSTFLTPDKLSVTLFAYTLYVSPNSGPPLVLLVTELALGAVVSDGTVGGSVVTGGVALRFTIV